MSKKIFCLALALMMLVCSTAFAASSPSSGSVSSGVVSGGNKPSSGSTSKPSSSSSQTAEPEFVLEADMSKDAVAQAVLATILDAIANGVSVKDVFGEDAAAALAALEGVDLSTLDIATIFALTLANYDASYGEVVIAFETELADDLNVVAAALGVVNGEEVTWCILDAESAENNKVNVTFTEEVLSSIPAGSDLVLAVLTAE